jgi:glycosyltransferase involved in cell wall biosynthesis
MQQRTPCYGDMEKAKASAPSLKIAMIAPPWFDIPPRAYGGIEWMCYWLTEGLVARGHDVTFFAAGNDNTSAHFVQTFADPPSDRLGEALPDVLHAMAARRVIDTLSPDIVHDHTVTGPLAAARFTALVVVTAHGPVDGEIGEYYQGLDSEVALVAISEAQRRIGPSLNWVGTVNNAIPVDEYPLGEEKDDYVLWLGRMNPEKGPDIAIRAARAAGRRLILAGKCNEPRERRFFGDVIQPLLGDDVEWIGEATTEQKKHLLASARCLILPVQWNEPFGIVMIEAMASGTPVVALRAGSVPELVEHEVTGFVCDDPRQLAEGIERADLIDPQVCRKHVKNNFDVSTMVEGYEAVYRSAIGAISI